MAGDAAARPERRYEIDWLRMMAVFLLFFFHSARIFDPYENFYVQNDQLSNLLTYIFVWGLGPWQMSLFFLLAGASTCFALRFRSRGQYSWERFKRLFIPFIFAVYVLVPPQSYIGLISHSGESISYFSWLPDFLTLQSDDPDGYFMGGYTWGQMWFILHLLIYSLLALPIFLYLRRESGKRLIDRLASGFTVPGALFLFPLLLALLQKFPEIAGGNPAFYMALFISGFILFSDPRFGETIDRSRLPLLITGPVLFAVVLTISIVQSWPVGLTGWAADLADAYFEGFVPWLVILSLLAWGRRLLGFSNRFLAYFAEASYPLYILHQTAIVLIGYWVVQTGLAIPLKFAIIVAASFAGCVLVYDLLVRRTNLTRFLFGMKAKTSLRTRDDVK
ncbi:MAG: acyltransferase family protein [Thermoleophilia bacterium]